MSPTRRKRPYLVFYIEWNSDSDVSPHTCGGDWIASATSAKNAVEQSGKLAQAPGSIAYAVPIEDCQRFEVVPSWKAAS